MRGREEGGGGLLPAPLATEGFRWLLTLTAPLCPSHATNTLSALHRPATNSKQEGHHLNASPIVFRDFFEGVEGWGSFDEAMCGY